jgi:hypothetical protein
VTGFWRGNFASARTHLEDALAACAPEPSPCTLHSTLRTLR